MVEVEGRFRDERQDEDFALVQSYLGYSVKYLSDPSVRLSTVAVP